MRNLILKLLLTGFNNRFVGNYYVKIVFGLIFFLSLFLWRKRGFFTGVQHLGFVLFFLVFLFVVIVNKLGINAHQQEQVRKNYKERKYQREMLLIVLTIILEIIITSILFVHPFAFILF